MLQLSRFRHGFNFTFMLDVGMGYVSLDPYTLFECFLACRPYITVHFYYLIHMPALGGTIWVTGKAIIDTCVHLCTAWCNLAVTIGNHPDHITVCNRLLSVLLWTLFTLWCTHTEV